MIETARLLLRPMRAEDTEDLLTIFADPAVMASFGGICFASWTLTQTEGFIVASHTVGVWFASASALFHALGAVAGVMVGTYYGVAHYQMGFLLGLKAFSAAVLGGIGNLAGAMLGGVLLGLIEALGAGYVGDLTNLCQLSSWSDAIAERCVTDPNLTLFGSNYQDVFAFLVLITVLIFRPSGLLGERVSERA